MTDVVVYPQLKWRRPESAALSALEASRNCACASGAAVVAWSTFDAQKPTHHDFRIAAGDPRGSDGKSRGLASSEALAAMLSFGAIATRYYGDDVSIAIEALKAGKVVQCAVDYGTINAYDGGKYSGQKTFSGGHALVLQGYVPDDATLAGRNSTTDHDPLFDGRCKSWGCAPLGPQQVPFVMMRQAMANFKVGGSTYATGKPIGPGKGIFIVAEQQPETDAEKIARLEAELAACKEQNG